MRERPLPKGCSGTTTVRLIREAGRDPIERDMLYRPVTRTETSFTVAV
jgi:aminodeoxyfutalosine synthase